MNLENGPDSALFCRRSLTMPVDAQYVKMIVAIYPIDPRVKYIASRCDLAMKKHPKLSYPMHLDVKHLIRIDTCDPVGWGSHYQPVSEFGK